MLAGLGRPLEPRGPALSLAGLFRNVVVAVGHDRILRLHGLRVGLATAFATALYGLLGPSFGYWIPLTVLAVLQPDRHSSRVRLLQRAAGTVVGAGGPAFGIHVSHQGRFSIVGGGFPIFVEGRIVGAVGCSSGTAEQDREVAEAAIQTFLKGMSKKG